MRNNQILQVIARAPITIFALLSVVIVDIAKSARVKEVPLLLMRMNISVTLSVESPLFRLNPFFCRQEISSTGMSGSMGKYRTCH